MSISTLECLPNELLLEVFLYLKPFDVLHSFARLNLRFEQTISQYRHNADLHHLTLKQFHYWIDHLLTSTRHSIVNLVLSNWNSPGKIFLFNQLIRPYRSLRQFLPNLRQLRIIDLTNADIEIVTKLDGLESIFIDADAMIPLNHASHIALDQHLFCSTNLFQEIRIWGGEGGLRLQHHVPIIENHALERLTISVALFDDFILAFRRAPKLLHYNIEVVQTTTKISRQNPMAHMLPQYIRFLHFQTSDRNVLSYEDFDKLIYHMPTIEYLSLDMDTDDLDYADGDNWHSIVMYLKRLKKIFFKLRIAFRSDLTTIDIERILESFEPTQISICAYTDSKLLHLDTIPYHMKEFNTNMSVTVSPHASAARTNRPDLFHQQSKSVQTLIVDGQHNQTPVQQWIDVMNRFASVEILQINAVNIPDEEQSLLDLDDYRSFRLSRLKYLHFIRSTNCRVNVPFFMFLTNRFSVSPQLKALSIMYGDLICLCKRLSSPIFGHIKELWIYAGDADGRVIPKDIDLVLHAFPYLDHFFFNHQSSRLINRHLHLITEMILKTMPRLTSFRISCYRGTLNLAWLTENSNHCLLWIRQVCQLTEKDPVHLIANKKMIALWK